MCDNLLTDFGRQTQSLTSSKFTSRSNSDVSHGKLKETLLEHLGGKESHDNHYDSVIRQTKLKHNNYFPLQKYFSGRFQLTLR